MAYELKAQWTETYVSESETLGDAVLRAEALLEDHPDAALTIDGDAFTVHFFIHSPAAIQTA